MTDPVALTRTLIHFDSSNPGACEKQIGAYLYDRLSNCGIHTWKQQVLPERENIVAEIPGMGNLPPLVMVCHMDTVVVGAGWTRPPFQAETQNGRIYGRGACDMKSGLSCALSAMEDLQSAGKPLNRALRLILTVDEEGDMRGIQAALREQILSHHCMLMDLEPTGLSLCTSHKGRMWYELETIGKTAHASMPWEGADAISAMAEFLSCARREVTGMPPHADMGRNTIVFGQIYGGYQPYVVPDQCKVTVDIRTVSPYGAQDIEAAFLRARAAAEERIPGVKYIWHLVSGRPWILGNYDTPLCQAIEQSYLETVGTPLRRNLFPGYTDTALAVATLGSGSCVSFGPGRLEQAHRPDEYVEIEEIRVCRRILDGLIEKLCLAVS